MILKLLRRSGRNVRMMSNWDRSNIFWIRLRRQASEGLIINNNYLKTNRSKYTHTLYNLWAYKIFSDLYYLSNQWTMSLRYLYCLINLVGYKLIDLSQPMKLDSSLQRLIYPGVTYMPTRPIMPIYVYKGIFLIPDVFQFFFYSLLI